MRNLNTDPADAINGLGRRQWDLLTQLFDAGPDAALKADELLGGRSVEGNVASLKTLHRRGLVERADGGLPREPVSTWTTKWRATQLARRALEAYL